MGLDFWGGGGLNLGGHSKPFRFFGSGGFALPYSIDFSTLADGPLPSPWSGATWAIGGGKAINTPTVGVELLTDPGLEATYTVGKCDTLTIDTGTYTLAQSADLAPGTTGAKAQEITASSLNGALRFNPRPTLATNKWYQISAYLKRTAGSASALVFDAGSTAAKPASEIFRLINDATYAQKKIILRAGGNNTLSVYFKNISTTYDTALADDCSAKEIQFPQIMALIRGVAGASVRAAINLTEGLVGICSHVDDSANPQNGIWAYWYRSNAYSYYIVEKLVNGSWSAVLGPTVHQTYATGYVPGKIVEIRYKAVNTFGLYYDGTQLGADLTISDASIVSNQYYGMSAAGGSALQSFFMGTA